MILLSVLAACFCRINSYQQDVVDRFWFTSHNGSESPPLPIDWPFLSLQSISQIIDVRSAYLWIVDYASNDIYYTKSSKSWFEELKPVKVNTNTTNKKQIINKNSHIILFETNVTSSTEFYCVITSSEILQFWYCSDETACVFLQQFDVSWSFITGSAQTTHINAYMGTSHGLYNLTVYNVQTSNPKNAKLSIELCFPNILVNVDRDILSVSYSDYLNILAVGVVDRVYRFNLSEISNGNIQNDSISYTWTLGLVDSFPSDMIFFHTDLYVVNNASINVLRYYDYISDDNTISTPNMQTWIRVGRHEKLPYDHILQICHGWDNSLWLAHSNGAVSRFMPNSVNKMKNNSQTSIEGQWRYYYGNRYIAGDVTGSIITMHSITSENMIMIATDSGISVIYSNETDLETKANQIEEINYPRHDRYGLLGDCALDNYGNLTSWYATPSDNNGLWTSVYLSGLAFKYDLTQNTQTLDRIDRHSNALKMLHNVTGINGLVARSYAKLSDGNYGSGWVNSTAMNGWQWKSDTSSDEICGHMFVYPVLYDLVASTPEDQTYFLEMSTSIMDYILENDYKLIDYDGQPTTWGFWDPHDLNQVHQNFDERGLNALQIMSWLLSCYYYTSLHITLYPQYSNVFDPDTYLQQWLYLGETHGYFANIVNQKITIPNDINWSDEELAAMAYMTFFWTQYQYNQNKEKFSEQFRNNWNENIQSKYPYFEVSWNRTFTFLSSPTAPRFMSWYSIMQLIAEMNQNRNDSYDKLKHWITEDLQRWPMEWINFPINNADRIDSFLDFTRGRECGSAQSPTCAFDMFAHDQINEQRWNSNPYKCNTGSGKSEVDTGSFTMVYWLARYFEIV